MSTNLDEIRNKLKSKEERVKILREINDITYFGPVGELIKELQIKNEFEFAQRIHILENKAVYLRMIINIGFEEIEKLKEK
jgi:hypothetical protein